MKFNFDVPRELAHLKLDERGYPIPYFVPIVKGKPEFKYQDTDKRAACLKRNLCPICGKVLQDECYNITGPVGLKNRVSSDAMMHLVCAEFTLRVCPHLHFQKAERKTGTEGEPWLLPDKPAEIYLVKVLSWEAKDHMIQTKHPITKRDQNTRVTLIYYVPGSWEKYIYADNVLVKAGKTL